MHRLHESEHRDMLLTRQAWVEINTGAIRRNFRALSMLTKSSCRCMAVVKADAYGHGALEVARACKAAGADMFGVATVAEGVELREGGIKLPILILSQPPTSSIEYILRYQLMPSIYTMEFALELGERAAAASVVVPYHLKIDTGMNRVGVHHHDVVTFMRNISFHRGLELHGCFTHFATADNVNDWDFDLQLKRFVDALSALHAQGIDLGIVHCCNTAATLLHLDAHFDMVRLGIGIYGLYPAPSCYKKVVLEPVMSVKALASYVKRPSIGEGVSYNLSYRVPKNIQIATIPLGYADGLPRVLSNNMDVLYKGVRQRQVGAICMDQCMIEIDANPYARSYVPEIEIGDELVIVGGSGQEYIGLEELSARAHTIHYELACAFGRRLDRVYLAY